MKPHLVEALLNGAADHPVKMFIESASSINRFSNHFKRTSNALLRKYSLKAGSILESHTAHPTDAGNTMLVRIAADCKKLFEASQAGDRGLVSSLLPKAYENAVEAENRIRGFGPAGIGSSVMVEDTKFSDEHTAFCRKLCKKFGVEEDRHESVAEGLYVFFDPENTAKLCRHTQFDVSNFAFENDYILIRAGSVDDFSFGSFGEELSKWAFVYLTDQPEET